MGECKFNCATCGRSEWEAEECRRVDCPGKKSCEVGVQTGSGANGRQIGGAHYASDKVQHWDFVMGHKLNYLEGNATKYLSRWRKKNGLQDLEKAEHYVTKLIELAQAGLRSESNASLRDCYDFCESHDMGQREYGVFAIIATRWEIYDLVVARDALQTIIGRVKLGEEV